MSNFSKPASAALLAFTCCLASVGAGAAQRTWCSDSLVRGTYGIQLSGTRTVPGGGGTETVIGVVVRHYEDGGTFQQWDNIRGSQTGFVPDRYGVGTYHVNDDCTIDIVFQPAPGVTIVERGVIVDHGNEIRTISTVPGVMVSATHIRVR